MLKRPHYLALGLVVVLTLVVLNLPHHATSQIKLAIGSLFLPLFGLSKTSHQALSHVSDVLVPRSELLQQNEMLRHANQELLARMMQGQGAMRENEQLRQLFGWEKQTPWKVKLASVIARDPANWWNILRIDAGSRDGVRTNMPVLTADGLVGRISAVSLTSSQVSLIGSSDCKVGAKVDKTGDTGVITGVSSPLDNTLVTLSYLSSGNNLKPGQRVVTWGVEGGIFPKDIIIGQIAEDSQDVAMGYTEARVKLAANLGALEEVWVLLE